MKCLMEYSEFMRDLFLGMRRIALTHSLVEIVDKEYRMRPSLSWELKSEYFFLRIGKHFFEVNGSVVEVGFHDPEWDSSNFEMDCHLSFSELDIPITPGLIVFREHPLGNGYHTVLDQESLKYALGVIAENLEKVMRAVDRMTMSDRANGPDWNWAGTVYALMKWMDGNDSVLERILCRPSCRPLVLKVARQMGREEEILRVIRNIEAGKQIL